MRTLSRRSVALAIAGVLVGMAAAEATAQTLTTLFSFSGQNGASPWSGLIPDSAGNLYGTTNAGGASGNGTIYRLAPGSNVLTTLASFSGSNGRQPIGDLYADAGGNLYGATNMGGPSNVGTIFRLAAGTSSISTIVGFNTSNGSFPTGGLVADPAGNLYGTTTTGGSALRGTAFRIAAGTNTLTTLASFGGVNGSDPYAGLMRDTAGNLYGTTNDGGPNAGGTVFRIAAGTNVLTTLASFGSIGPADPAGALIADAAGNVYGTTMHGGATGRGAIFKIAAGTNTLTTLASFTGAHGTEPRWSLTSDAVGNLFGVTARGGTHDRGTVFRWDAATGTLTTVISFNGANGGQPGGRLIPDAEGNLYGTAADGGANNLGTVFRLSGAGFVVPAPATWGIPLAALLPLIRRRRGRIGYSRPSRTPQTHGLPLPSPS